MFWAARFSSGPASLPEEIPISGNSPTPKVAVKPFWTSQLCHDPTPLSAPGFIIYCVLFL